MANWRPWVGKAIFESALIVFGVLLALNVENWRNASDRRHRLDEARTHLVEEMKFNRELIASQDYLPHHRRLLGIYKEMDTAGHADGSGPLFDTGVHAAPLRTAAWRSFVGSDVSGDLPFTHRALLEAVYAEQQSLGVIQDTLFGAIVSPRADSETPAFKKSFVKTIRFCLGDIVSSEQRLAEQSDRAIAALSAPRR